MLLIYDLNRISSEFYVPELPSMAETAAGAEVPAACIPSAVSAFVA